MTAEQSNALLDPIGDSPYAAGAWGTMEYSESICEYCQGLKNELFFISGTFSSKWRQICKTCWYTFTPEQLSITIDYCLDQGPAGAVCYRGKGHSGRHMGRSW